MSKRSCVYNPNAYSLRRLSTHRGYFVRVSVFVLALVLVCWGGSSIAKSGIAGAFTTQTFTIQSASECMNGAGSWEQAPAQMLSSLSGKGQGMMNNVINNLMGQMESMIGEWISGIVGSRILNLSQTTQHIAEKVTNGIKEATGIQLKFEDLIKSKPGGLNMRWCYSDYSGVHAYYGQMIRSDKMGPTSGDWKIGNYYSTMIKGNGLHYPDADEAVYSGNPSAYVDQVAKTTVGMGGPGTSLSQMIAKSNMSQEDKDKFSGMGQQARALSQINTALATDGADAITYSGDVWRRMSQFNPDSWDNGYPEQAMKDIPKLLYVTNQLLAKMLRVQGELAIQQSAVGQTKTNEMTQKAFSDFMNISRGK